MTAPPDFGEPWKQGKGRDLVLDADGLIAAVASPTKKAGCNAIAERIVACVNACRGIPTEKLTGTVAFIDREELWKILNAPTKGGDSHEEGQEEAQGR